MSVIYLPENLRAHEQKRKDDQLLFRARARKVDQHPVSEAMAVAVSTIKKQAVESLSLNALMMIILDRLKDDDIIQGVSDLPLFQLWTEIDQELERRKQPEFVSFTPQEKNFSPGHNPDDEAIDRAIEEEMSLRGYMQQGND